MVQILQPIPTFGQMMGRAVGEGVKGATDLYSQMQVEKYKAKQTQKLIDQIENEGKEGTPKYPAPPPSAPGSPADQVNMGELASEFAADLEEMQKTTGQKLTPEQKGSYWQKFMESKNKGQPEAPPEQEGSKAEKYRKQALKSSLHPQLQGYSKAKTAQADVAEKEESKIRAEQRELERFPKKEFIEHEAKANSAYMDSIRQTAKDLPNTEFSLAMIEDALGDAGKWAAAKDTLAEKTGFMGFRSAAGAELDSAIKNYFLGDLSSIKGGRPNVFIEKQLRDAYQKAGLDPISNQKITLGMRMKESINREMVSETQKLYDKFIEEKGFLPPNFQEIVRKSLSERVGGIEKKTINTLHNLSKIEAQRDKIFRAHLKSGETLMMSPEGDPFAVPKNEIDTYKEQGYIPLGKK